MTSQHPVYTRILRRETHSPRSGAAITIAIVAILLFAWIGTEAVLASLKTSALLVAPATALTALANLPALPQGFLLAGGAVLVVVAVVLIVITLSPGARALHRLSSSRCAVVVDDTVLADALVRQVSFGSGIEPSQIKVYLGRRTAHLRVVPSLGLSLDPAELREMVAAELESYDLRLSAKVTIAHEGVIA